MKIDFNVELKDVNGEEYIVMQQGGNIGMTINAAKLLSETLFTGLNDFLSFKEKLIAYRLAKKVLEPNEYDQQEIYVLLKVAYNSLSTGVFGQINDLAKGKIDNIV